MSQQIFQHPPFIPVFEDYSCFKDKHIGITGHLGVLGSIITKKLEDHSTKVTFYPGDITDYKSLQKWFAKHNFDYFFHFAAVVPVTEVQGNPLNAYESNVIGTYYICKEIIKTQKSCWLFISSSSHVYENPLSEKIQYLNENSPKAPMNFYGKTKLLAEQLSIPLLEQYNIDYCIGRIFSFTSAIQKPPYLVPTLREKIKNAPENSTLNIINPDSIRDITDAETVIDCILHLTKRRHLGIINIGSGQGRKVIDIARHLVKLSGKNIKIEGTNLSPPNSLIADTQLLRKALNE